MLLTLLACGFSPPEPPEPTESHVNPFKLKARTTAGEGRMHVELVVRTPGGDIPVQRADTSGIVATVDGTPAAVDEVAFEPGAHGCKVRFTVDRIGTLGLDGTLPLLNPDGGAWVTLQLSEATIQP